MISRLAAAFAQLEKDERELAVMWGDAFDVQDPNYREFVMTCLARAETCQRIERQALERRATFEVV